MQPSMLVLLVLSDCGSKTHKAVILSLNVMEAGTKMVTGWRQHGLYK